MPGCSLRAPLPSCAVTFRGREQRRAAFDVVIFGPYANVDAQADGVACSLNPRGAPRRSALGADDEQGESAEATEQRGDPELAVGEVAQERLDVHQAFDHTLALLDHALQLRARHELSGAIEVAPRSPARS